MRPTVQTSKAYQSYVKRIQNQLKTSGKTLESVELAQDVSFQGIAGGCTSPHAGGCTSPHAGGCASPHAGGCASPHAGGCGSSSPNHAN